MLVVEKTILVRQIDALKAEKNEIDKVIRCIPNVQEKLAGNVTWSKVTQDAEKISGDLRARIDRRGARIEKIGDLLAPTGLEKGQKQDLIQKNEANPESKLLFSVKKNEQQIARAIALTRAYYKLWQDQYQQNSNGEPRLVRKALLQPDSTDFRTNYALAEEIVNTDSEQMRTYSLEYIQEINNTFKTIVQQKPEQLRPALKDAIARTRTLYDWATKFQSAFGKLEEPWIQNGLKILDITKDNLGTNFNEFQTDYSSLPNHIKSGGPAVSDIVEGDSRTQRPAYNINRIIEDFEKHILLNARLQYHHGLLNDGIPSESPPYQINNLRRVYDTSSNKNNCLIHALLQAHNPTKKMDEIERRAESIRNTLKVKMSAMIMQERKNDTLDETSKAMLLDTLSGRQEAVKKNEMLDLGSFDGQKLIQLLRESNDIDSNRGVRVYKWDTNTKKISFFEQVPHTDPANEPYTLFLYQDFHFEAMIPHQRVLSFGDTISALTGNVQEEKALKTGSGKYLRGERSTSMRVPRLGKEQRRAEG